MLCAAHEEISTESVALKKASREDYTSHRDNDTDKQIIEPVDNKHYKYSLFLQNKHADLQESLKKDLRFEARTV